MALDVFEVSVLGHEAGITLRAQKGKVKREQAHCRANLSLGSGSGLGSGLGLVR